MKGAPHYLIISPKSMVWWKSIKRGGTGVWRVPGGAWLRSFVQGLYTWKIVVLWCWKLKWSWKLKVANHRQYCPKQIKLPHSNTKYILVCPTVMLQWVWWSTTAIFVWFTWLININTRKTHSIPSSVCHTFCFLYILLVSTRILILKY